MAQTDPDMLRQLTPGQKVAQIYKVISRLGEGGFGTVYLGEETTLGQSVVIKLLKDGSGTGLEEAKLLTGINHPKVVRVFAYDAQTDCYVMEHLKGQTLWSLMQRRLHPITALRIAKDVAEALDAVHAQGLVHRDVKPDNVMVQEGGKDSKLWIKLLDFGVAKVAGKVLTGPAAGTVEYASPEMFDPSVPALTANDVYALGVMLFEMCARRLPFDGPDPTAICKLHLHAPVPSLLETRRAWEQDAEAERQARLKGNGSVAVDEPPIDVLDEEGERLFADIEPLVRAMMDKDPARRPEATTIIGKLDKLIWTYANEKTQTAFRNPFDESLNAAAAKPIPLTRRAAPSTAVLPRGPSTSAALKAIDPPAEKRSRQVLLVAAAALLLFAVVGFIAFGSGSAGTSTAGPPDAATAIAQADPPPVPKNDPPPVVEQTVDAGTVVAVADPPDELDPMPKLPKVDPKKDPKKNPKNTAVVVEATGCEPDADWKRQASLNLKELTQRSAKMPDLMLWASEENDALSRAIASASTRGECAQVDQRLRVFTAKVFGKGQ
ncbi:MAG: serine/threonine-protein kinase [Myxococcaceae bacterium]